jgi:hypothetical protein
MEGNATMKTVLLIASGIVLAALANTALPRPAHALTMSECSAKYKAAKSAGTLNGMKWNDFRKAQCGSEASAAPAAAAAPAPAPSPAPAAAAPAPAAPAPAATAAEPGKKPVSAGRQAMVARERACGADWKAAKAAGKIPTGQKWPQYWSECNKRKKAEGM